MKKTLPFMVLCLASAFRLLTELPARVAVAVGAGSLAVIVAEWLRFQWRWHRPRASATPPFTVDDYKPCAQQKEIAPGIRVTCHFGAGHAGEHTGSPVDVQWGP